MDNIAFTAMLLPCAGESTSVNAMQNSQVLPEDLQQTIARRGQFPSRQIEGEGMVVSTAKGAAILLNGVGFQLWNWINDQRSGEEILTLLCDNYEVERQRAQEDLLAFLARLMELELVEMRDIRRGAAES